MSLTIGLVLLAVGIVMFFIGRAPKAGDIRPFLRAPLMQTAYISTVLACIAIGGMLTVTSL